MTLIYGSVCSGIEAASVAWTELGWSAAFLSEIDLFSRAVLETRYPDVQLHGDFTTIKEGQYGSIDLLVGGTPCQDFSVAGLRRGLDGERGQLTIEFVRLAERLRPRWLVWENVPGVLSIDEGRAFGSFLWLLGECGYGFAYRILDAQYFGVPQRRRRVFVVGYLGDWRPAAAVLFEPESLRRDSPPRREKGQGIARPVVSSHRDGSGYRNDADTADNLIAFHGSQDPNVSGEVSHPLGRQHNGMAACVAYGGNRQSGPVDVATAVNAHGGPHGRLDFESETFIVHSIRAEGFDAIEDGTGRGTPLVPVAFFCKDHGADAGDIAPTLRAMEFPDSHANAGGQLAVAFHENQRAEITLNDTAGSLKVGGGKPGQGYPAVAVNLRGREGGSQPEMDDVVSLRAASGGSSRSYVQTMSVRRLTPTECERLQGFPDGWTAITYRGKPAADGPRYRALGNSMAVPVMRWIGERIAMTESILRGIVT